MKFQNCGHLMQSTDSLEKTLMLRKIEGKRGEGAKMIGWHHWLNEQECEETLRNSEGQKSLVFILHRFAESDIT